MAERVIRQLVVDLDETEIVDGDAERVEFEFQGVPTGPEEGERRQRRGYDRAR